MSINEKDFFPRFCDTPPLAFIKGSAEKIDEEQARVFEDYFKLCNKKLTLIEVLKGEKKENQAKQWAAYERYDELTDISVEAYYLEQEALERHERFFEKTGRNYAECIFFASQYPIYLDDNGELFYSKNTENVSAGDVIDDKIELFPLCELGAENEAKIVEFATSVLPKLCCRWTAMNSEDDA